jgi:hypothetical protein
MSSHLTAQHTQDRDHYHSWHIREGMIQLDASHIVVLCRHVSCRYGEDSDNTNH